VAFATAIGHCVDTERNGDKTNLTFPLTMAAGLLVGSPGHDAAH
jgi:hypothetical protein